MSISLTSLKNAQTLWKLCFLCILFAFFPDSSALNAQQPSELFLQIERKNRLKTIRLVPGDVFEIKLYKDSNRWIRVRLQDLEPDNNQIITDFGQFHLDDIMALRTQRQNKWGNGIFYRTLTFAAGTLLFSLADLFYGNPYNWEFVAVAGGMLGLSYLIKTASRAFYYRFNRKHRLRIIDLRM